MAGRPGRCGGARPGAGRKKGAHNKASIERQKKVQASGAVPLDVMLKRMRFHDRKADEALKAKNDKEAERHLREADEAARGAAPYVHPKLSSVEMTGGLKITHEDALAQLD